MASLDPHTCVYPSCATFQAQSDARFFFCRKSDGGGGAALGLCKGELEGDDALRILSAHLMFVGDEHTPWPGRRGEFYVEDNTCDTREDETRCYLKQAADGLSRGITFHELERLNGCVKDGSCEKFRFELERVAGNNAIDAYRWRTSVSSSSSGSHQYIGVGSGMDLTNATWTALRLVDLFSPTHPYLQSSALTILSETQTSQN